MELKGIDSKILIRVAEGNQFAKFPKEAINKL